MVAFGDETIFMLFFTHLNICVKNTDYSLYLGRWVLRVNIASHHRDDPTTPSQTISAEMQYRPIYKSVKIRIVFLLFKSVKKPWEYRVLFFFYSKNYFGL